MAETKLAPFLENFPKISVEDLLELFRDLRQSTTSRSQQDENAREIEPCVRLLANMVEYLKAGSAQNVIDKFVLSTCARVGVQFLGNAIVENENNQKLLWSHSDFLKKIFCYDDTKVKNYICMVYYNIMLSNVAAREDMLADDDFIFMLLDEAILGLTEFPQFIVEKFIEYNYYDKLYSDARRPLHRIYILDMIVSMVKSTKNNFELDSKHVKKISDDFKKQAELILDPQKQEHENIVANPEQNGVKSNVESSEQNQSKNSVAVSEQNGTVGNSEQNVLKNSVDNSEQNGSKNSVDDLEQNEMKNSVTVSEPNGTNKQLNNTPDPRLTVKLLSTLCSLSSDDKYNKLICDNSSLVIDTIYVLKALKMVEDAQKEDGCEPDENNSPIIGFKADVIRLIGNLCWKHKKNQDLVRENDCIPFILDCCKLDEKNPFICEWSIMAIRNLCENNQENKDFIASLKRITETDLVAMSERMKLDQDNQNSL